MSTDNTAPTADEATITFGMDDDSSDMSITVTPVTLPEGTGYDKESLRAIAVRAAEGWDEKRVEKAFEREFSSETNDKTGLIIGNHTRFVATMTKNLRKEQARHTQALGPVMLVLQGMRGTSWYEAALEYGYPYSRVAAVKVAQVGAAIFAARERIEAANTAAALEAAGVSEVKDMSDKAQKALRASITEETKATTEAITTYSVHKSKRDALPKTTITSAELSTALGKVMDDLKARQPGVGQTWSEGVVSGITSVVMQFAYDVVTVVGHSIPPSLEVPNPTLALHKTLARKLDEAVEVREAAAAKAAKQLDEAAGQ